MGRRAKTPRFEEFKTLANCFDAASGKIDIAGYLGGPPYVLEVGCGRGDFSVELARRHPGRRFVGVDYKSDRMWRGAKTALTEELANVAFLRARAEGLPQIFAPGNVEEIWITFPDPYPKKSDAKKRLTHPAYLDIYVSLLAPNGELLFKTDNHELFAWSKVRIEKHENFAIKEVAEDLHAAAGPDDDMVVRTAYEQKFMESGSTICFLRALRIA